MLLKKLLLLLIGLTVVLTSCSTNNTGEPNITSSEKGVRINETEGNESENIEVPGLKERLLQASSVELKNIHNESLGVLQERDAIISFVGKLFAYPIKENYIEKQQANAVGPINFYFTGGDDIYGLIKENYIYLEGHYFLINRKELENLKNIFKANAADMPVTDE